MSGGLGMQRGGGCASRPGWRPRVTPREVTGGPGQARAGRPRRQTWARSLTTWQEERASDRPGVIDSDTGGRGGS